MSLTTDEYSSFQDAYTYFNDSLFDSRLPDVIITLQRKNKTRGYFSPSRFSHKLEANLNTHELALNPDHFNRDDTAVLSTLVHEMVHLWQEEFGKPSRKSYHNKEWGNKMKSIGLYPSSTGEAGGKETGQCVSHYILPNEPFAITCQQLIDSGFKLKWQSNKTEGKAKKQTESKLKYTCPNCEANAWGKPFLRLVCGDCDVTMQTAI